jgi:hypothetical protein
LDYSFSTHHPRGDLLDYQSPGGGSPTLRKQLKILKDFIHGFDFIKMLPKNEVIKGISEGVKARALVEEGNQYAIYIHEPPEAGKEGKEREVEITVELPEGTYRYEWLNTKTGEVEKRGNFRHTGGYRTFITPVFREDIALRILRR